MVNQPAATAGTLHSYCWYSWPEAAAAGAAGCFFVLQQQKLWLLFSCRGWQNHKSYWQNQERRVPIIIWKDNKRKNVHLGGVYTVKALNSALLSSAQALISAQKLGDQLFLCTIEQALSSAQALNSAQFAGDQIFHYWGLWLHHNSRDHISQFSRKTKILHTNFIAAI